MKPPRHIRTDNIPLSDISCEGRLRPVSQVDVDSLKASIQEIGLTDEIHVRRIKKSGELRLLAGARRLEAFRQLEHDAIPAKVWESTDDQAQIIEIDDNLAHADLSPLDLAVFLAVRKEAYERLYPATRQGGNRGNQHTGGRQTDILSFCQSVAKNRDVSERQVRRLVSAGGCLSAANIELLRKAPQRIALSDLQVIAKSGDPADRSAICVALSEGTAKSAREVLRSRQLPGKSVDDPVEGALSRIQDAWDRAPKEAQRRFVTARAEELRELLDAIAVGPAEVVPFKARDRGKS